MSVQLLIPDEEILESALAQAKSAGAAQVDAVLIRSDSREARVRGEEIEFVKQASERCLGLRAMVQHQGGKSTALTSTSDLSAQAIEEIAKDTVALARVTAADECAGLPDEASAKDLPDLGTHNPSDRDVSIETRIEEAQKAEQAARSFDSRIDNSEGSEASSNFSHIIYGHSDGFTGSYQSAYHSLSCSPLATQGETKQVDYWSTVGRSLADLEDPESVGRKAAERALGHLGARRIPTCEAPVIFDSLVAPGLLRQVASCLSGYSVYRKSSFLADRMGDSIASERVTLTDDGRRPGGLGSKPFDGEGLATRRNVLIQNGKLQSWLLDSYSGRKLGLPTTGNASRSVGSAPGVSTTNLWLEPGTGTLDAIIEDTGTGLLVTQLMGMGFNATTGDYSQGARGFWIEKGRVAFPVEEITIASNLGTMLQKIDAIGEELIWRGLTASPPIRISEMTIAGE